MGRAERLGHDWSGHSSPVQSSQKYMKSLKKGEVLKMVLKKEELNEVIGGGISLSILGIIGAIGVFIAGVVDGFLRPLRCN